MPSLATWSQTLRPYQSDAVARALAVPPGGRLLLSAPTGTGKGTMQLGLLKALRDLDQDAWIVTPSLEVLRGYLERCGATAEELQGSAAALAKLGELIYVTTPVRLRNALAKGQRAAPQVLIADEAHHATSANVAGGGLAGLCPTATWIGWTATPYRGSPEETHALRETWGSPHSVLTIPEAAANGSWALPTWRVEPLVDDDEANVVRGELDADELTISSVGPLADLVASLNAIPTCVTVGNCDAAKALATALLERGAAPHVVLGDTPAAERATAYAAVRDQQPPRSVLVSVRVLGEGVDLPWLRRLVDARPTLSPVAWLQQVGRITRPGAVQPEYIGTNRNMERHGYLLQGALPRAALKEAQERFGGASKRGARAGLIKGVGRAKPVQLPLSGGGWATMWALSQPGTVTRELMLILDPTADRVLCAARIVNPRASGRDRWGEWRAAEPPATPEKGLKPPKWSDRPLSQSQSNWWKKDAKRVGLDPKRVDEVTAAGFWALPALLALRATMAAEEITEPAPARAPAAVGGDTGAAPPPTPSAPEATDLFPVVSPAESVSPPSSGAGGSSTRQPRALRGTWAKLRSGAWGARIPDGDVRPGDSVTIRRQSGGETERVVDHVVWASRDEALSLCELAAESENPRGPQTEAERWAVGALAQLAGDDQDRARERNDMGFSAFDGEAGHRYARGALNGGLTDREWSHALRMLRIYKRQVGVAPGGEG